MSNNVLSAHALSWAIKDKRILDQVSLELKPGELLGIIGPNGAGKSSLAKLLANLQNTATGGERLLLGKPYENWKSQDFSRCLAYLEQDAQIHWPLTVERVISLGRLPQRHPLQAENADDHEAIHKAMQRCDILHLATRSVAQLSTGEKALVNLARVLAGQPRLIIADEPAAALDPYHQLLLMETLQDLSRGQQQVAVLLILHDLNMAARFCDRLLLLDQGKVIANGSPSQVLTPNLLQQVYRIEAQITTTEQGLLVTAKQRS